MSKKDLPSYDELQRWSVMNVADWLKEAGFGESIDAFIDANVDGVKLSQLSEQDLLYMGNVPLGQRKKILKAISAVVKTENKPTKGIGKLGNKLGIGKPEPPPKDFKPESNNNNNDDTYDWDSDSEWDEDNADDVQGGFDEPDDSDDSADYEKPENNLPPPPTRRQVPPTAPAGDDDVPPPLPPPRPPKPGDKPGKGGAGNKPPALPSKNFEPTEDYEVPEAPQMQDKPPPLPPNHPKQSQAKDEDSDDEYETPKTDSGGSMHDVTKPKISPKSPLPPLPKDASSPHKFTKPKPSIAEKKVPPVPSFKPQPAANKPAVVPKPLLAERTKNIQNKESNHRENDSDSKDSDAGKEKAGGIKARIAALQQKAGSTEVPVAMPGKVGKAKTKVTNDHSTVTNTTSDNDENSSISSSVNKKTLSPEAVEKKPNHHSKGGAKALPPIPVEEPDDTPPPPPSLNTIPHHKKGHLPAANKSPSFNPGSRPLPAPPGGSQNMDEDSLESNSWYHGDIARDVSDQRLKSLGTNGSFLVRLSKKGGPTSPYSLSLFHEGRVWNLHIRKKTDGSYALGNEKPNELSFQSVPELISYHQTNPLVLAGAKSGQTQLRNTPDKS